MKGSILPTTTDLDLKHTIHKYRNANASYCNSQGNYLI